MARMLNLPPASLPAKAFGVGFTAWLGDLQLFAHYVTGPLVPNTRAKYGPA
jgi:hypothetical protein